MSVPLPPEAWNHSSATASLAVVTLCATALAAWSASPRSLRRPSVVVATVALVVLLALTVVPGTALAACVGLPLSVLPAFAIRYRGRTSPVVRATLLFALAGSALALSVPWLRAMGAADGASAVPGIASFLAALALLVRLGVFPFHAWIPALVEEAPLPVTWLLAATPLVPVLASSWLLPQGGDDFAILASLLLPLGVASALYGSVLALVQSRLRRMIGYLLVSQAGTMLVALLLGAPHEVTGPRLAAVAYGLPCGGLLALAAAVRARAGTDEIVRLGGLIAPAPHMGTAFLVLGFSAVGFPGSLAFVAEDLMMHVVLESHPWSGALLLLATALNAIAVFRAFQKVFLGPLPRSGVLDRLPDLQARERVVVLAVAAIVITAGLFPAPVVDFANQANGAGPPIHGEAR